MGCCNSKQKPIAMQENAENGEREALLNGNSSQEDEAGYGRGSEYNVVPLPSESSPSFPRANEERYGSTSGARQRPSTHPQTSTSNQPRFYTQPQTGQEGDVFTQRGRQVMEMLKQAYRWRDEFNHPSQEFLSRMDKLYMECQLHLTTLSSRDTVESHREADIIVNEMVQLRNYWGPQLLPSSVCNAFVRERVSLTLGSENQQFRIDCAQFFEPVPFYGNQQGNPGELMKLYRFSVYDVSRNEVILRYYLERSNVIQVYHVLCYTLDSYRGQVHPYGSESPSYWELRQHMLEDVRSRVLGILQRGRHTPSPRPHAVSADNPPLMQASPLPVATADS